MNRLTIESKPTTLDQFQSPYTVAESLCGGNGTAITRVTLRNSFLRVLEEVVAGQADKDTTASFLHASVIVLSRNPEIPFFHEPLEQAPVVMSNETQSIKNLAYIEKQIMGERNRIEELQATQRKILNMLAIGYGGMDVSSRATFLNTLDMYDVSSQNLVSEKVQSAWQEILLQQQESSVRRAS